MDVTVHVDLPSEVMHRTTVVLFLVFSLLCVKNVALQCSSFSVFKTLLLFIQSHLQVRVLADHGDMMSKDGKVVLRKDTTHWLPVDEVEALIRAGVVEYLHAGMTM